MNTTLYYSIAIVALLSAAMVVATGGTSPDVVSHHETKVLELEPPESDGVYTNYDESGEVQIVLTEENENLSAAGVNSNAVTDVGPVLVVRNVPEHGSNATVWIDHASEHVTFSGPDGEPIESQDKGALLQPGDELTVSLRVDTTETDQITLESIGVMAKLDPAIETPTESGGNNGGSNEQSYASVDDDDDDTPTGTDTPEPTTPTPDDPGTGTPGESGTPATTSTPAPTDTPVGEPGGIDAAMVGGLVALLGALGGGLFLARRLGFP